MPWEQKTIPFPHTIKNTEIRYEGQLPYSGITIDYDKRTLTITESTKWLNEGTAQKHRPDQLIYFGVCKEKKRTVLRDNHSPSPQTTVDLTGQPVMDVYEMNQTDDGWTTSIDLSFLKNTTDNVIQLRGNQNQIDTYIYIPTIAKKVRASIINGYVLGVSLTDDKNSSFSPAESIEFRKSTGNWTDYTCFETPLTECQQRGATLYFRVKASEKATLEESDNSFYPDTSSYIHHMRFRRVDKLDFYGDPTVLEVANAGNFASPEAKVVIKKPANAPKISVNYNKQIISIPKGVAYRYIPFGCNSSPEWFKTYGKTLLRRDSELDNLLPTGGTLEIKVPATDTKPASKIGVFDYFIPKNLIVERTSDTGPSSFQPCIDDPIPNIESSNRLAINTQDELHGGYVTLSSDISVILQDKKKKLYSLVLPCSSNTSVKSWDSFELLIMNTPPEDHPNIFAQGAKTVKCTRIGKNYSKNGYGAIVKNLKEGQAVYIRHLFKNEWSTEYVPLGTIQAQ